VAYSPLRSKYALKMFPDSSPKGTQAYLNMPKYKKYIQASKSAGYAADEFFSNKPEIQ